jgi:hypothetical protein
MKPLSLLAAFTIPLLGVQAGMPSSVRAQAPDTVQWRVMGVHWCARADTLFGRQWRSHASIIRVSYSRRRDTTTITTPHRNLSWQQGSSRLKASESAIRLPGQLRPADSARIQLSLGFVDSIYRTPEQAQLDLFFDDSVHFQIQEPHIDYVMGVKSPGIPLVVTALLTPEQSLALARAHTVRGTMGPIPFVLFDWELWEINAIYRGSFCGVE